MKVAYVCADSGVPVFGTKGCSVHVQEVVRALRRAGADVSLFAARTGGQPPRDLASVPVHPLPVPRNRLLRSRLLADRRRTAAGANELLQRSLERAGPFDFVYERYSLWSEAGMQYARQRGVPGLLEVNAPLIDEQVNYRGQIDRAAAEQVAERVFGAATAVLAVSEGVAAWLEQYPAARKRVHVVPNGVDPVRIRPGVRNRLLRSRLLARRRRQGAFTIGFVGSLKPWHGLTVLAEAFERLHGRHPAWRLMIVGDGPERAGLASRFRAEGLDAVHFTGAVPPDEIPSLLASLDVAVAPYANLPGFYFSPLKVYEYMAAELPVVASRIGQLARIIEHGVNGILCPPGDAAALADALEGLGNDPELRRQLGRAARETVLREHTWDAVARRILELAGFSEAGSKPGSVAKAVEEAY